MDKRSPKSPVLFERYKSGRAWGLMRFCDVRLDHSNRKLISNGKGLNTHVADDRFTKNRFDLLSDFEEKGHYIHDGVESKTLTTNSDTADITRIREQEMATEKHIKNKITNTRAERVLSDSQPTHHVPRIHRRKASKTFQMHGCKDIATLGSYENSVDTSSKKSNPAALTEASCNRAHPKKGKDSSCRSISSQKHDQIGETELQVGMNGAADAFINQKFIKGRYPGRDRTNQQSKHFLDALDVLNSNKDLFIKLLQDPNSLLVKHIQDLRDSQAKEKETKFSENRSIARKCEYPSKESVDPQLSDTIVVLKPDLTSMQNSAIEISECSSPQLSLYCLRNRAQSDKPAYFSFEHMKRKLRHAIGLRRKEKISMSTGSTLHKSSRDIQGLGDGGKGKSPEVAESNLQSKINLGIDRTVKVSPDVKKIEKKGKANDFESGIRRQVVLNGGSGHENSKLSMVRHLKQREAYMDAESRERLSEILKKSNENFSRRQELKNLGKTIFLPEYDFLSTPSPGRLQEHGFIAAQMRFSPYGNYQMVNEKKQRLLKELENKYLSSVNQTVDQLQTLHAKPNIPQNHFSDIKIHESVCSVHDALSPRGSMKIVETYNTTSPGEISYVGVSSKANGICNTSANQSATANTCIKNGYLEHLKLVKYKFLFLPDSPAESCTSPTSKETDGMKDKAEHPSPVSVLEQFLDEDITSPPSSRLEPAEPTTEPKQINNEQQCSAPFVGSPEDLKINSSNVMDEHEPMSKYVRALLQVSGINWDELSTKSYSSEQILEPSLFDHVEALPDLSCADPRLLFDYMNEVLLEVYQCYFSCSQWVSLVKPKIQPILTLKNVDYEVMRCVNWDLLSQRPSLTLQQLVEKDLAKSGSWMDIHIDTESAISEVVDSVLEELTLETAIDLNI
ncbi:hypothetical protein JRO89_XS13G0162100 [Xanthoceras sorbifolium]|uniref:DUF4378 domain-containing protein n=1 Tax=Xanthoceras sorbifolium TaxID=99658 RepID=A0ABQ8H8L8_9ROSI|nr:hypothetical protein JRO89_XS13G0162100 [Xanthoceras sorbifolium]